MIVINPAEGLTVENLEIRPMVLVTPDCPMLDLLNKFQADRCHIALIVSDPVKVQKAWDENEVVDPDIHMMGIVTLEDVIEELIQEETWDEQDDSMHTEVAKNNLPRHRGA